MLLTARYDPEADVLDYRAENIFVGAVNSIILSLFVWTYAVLMAQG